MCVRGSVQNRLLMQQKLQIMASINNKNLVLTNQISVPQQFEKLHANTYIVWHEIRMSVFNSWKIKIPLVLKSDTTLILTKVQKDAGVVHFLRLYSTVVASTSLKKHF